MMLATEICNKAYKNLYNKNSKYNFFVSYSGRMGDFNAKVLRRGYDVEFTLSKKWVGIDDDIVIGLFQELFSKLWKAEKTLNRDLYSIFVKEMHHLNEEPKVSDPEVLDSFIRVNDKYFGGEISQPNLRFGRKSRRTAGSYNFHSDTITISALLKGHPEVIDFVMHHELLHKSLKYDHTKSRNMHHTREFKAREREFEDYVRVDKELGKCLAKRNFGIRW